MPFGQQVVDQMAPSHRHIKGALFTLDRSDSECLQLLQQAVKDGNKVTENGAESPPLSSLGSHPTVLQTTNDCRSNVPDEFGISENIPGEH